MRIVVTVGMGPWPFDRLLRGVAPLCAAHEVFAQTGTSSIVMPCESAPFIAFTELEARLAEADLVITHAGNSVRLVQRRGKLPIASAREARFGEMANDHQVAYLRHEEALGRVVAAWDPSDIPRLVALRPEEWRLDRPLAKASAADAARRMTDIWSALHHNPFSWKTEPRLAYIWEELAFGPSRHLHLGIGGNALGRALRSRPGLQFEARVELRLATEPVTGEARYNSVSLYGEVGDEAAIIAVIPEACSALVEGGLLILAALTCVDAFIPRTQASGCEPIRRDAVGRLGFLTARKVNP